MSQTDGSDFVPETVGSFDVARALETLKIARIEFTHTDGNCQGFALPGRKIAVSPIAALPYKTTFHEVAHVLLGHCDDRAQSDSEHLTRNLKEVEAESVAMICCEAVGLPGAEYSRGYIQHWLRDSSIPEKSAQRIFKVADQILKAEVLP
jgi:hypothetical protein